MGVYNRGIISEANPGTLGEVRLEDSSIRSHLFKDRANFDGISIDESVRVVRVNVVISSVVIEERINAGASILVDFIKASVEVSQVSVPFSD